MQMQQGPADADLARQLADIVATAAGKRRDDPHTVRIGQTAR
jgi:hypothetical protein